MKYVLKALFLHLLLVCPTVAKEQTVGALLNEVIAEPGSWVQMCSIVRPNSPEKLPIGGFFRNWTEVKISEQNFLRLRARRTEVVSEIGKRLIAITPGTVKQARKEAEVFSGKKYELKVSNNLELYLVMLQDLNGVEALEELLALEAEVNKVGCYDSIKSSGSGVIWYPSHVQILSTITALLNNEQPHLLDKLPEPATYDKATRDTIARLARQFLKTTKPADYRGPKGMSPAPVAR